MIFYNEHELEYFIRLQKFEKIVEQTWQKYVSIEQDGLSLKEFAEAILDNYAEEKEETKMRRK